MQNLRTELPFNTGLEALSTYKQPESEESKNDDDERQNTLRIFEHDWSVNVYNRHWVSVKLSLVAEFTANNVNMS